MMVCADYMLEEILKVNCWQVLVELTRERRSDNNGDNVSEKVLGTMARFQRVKEIDEGIMNEVKDEGVMGFDKFKAYTLKMAEEEDKLAQHFLNQARQATIPSPQTSSQAFERKITFRNSSLMANQVISNNANKQPIRGVKS